jgi:diadenosine tetraphosphate (Ap4A) HIT family hydrolase
MKMSSRDLAPTTTQQDTTRCGQDLDHSGRCPFCNILLAFPPVDPLGDPQEIDKNLNYEKTNPPCVVVYSGERVLAFLDIQPLTWGHTLVIPRRHRVKMGDLEAADGAEVGFLAVFFCRPSPAIKTLFALQTYQQG